MLSLCVVDFEMNSFGVHACRGENVNTYYSAEGSNSQAD